VKCHIRALILHSCILIFTNLAEYDDLTPARKIVEEVLKETGKLRSGTPGAAGIQLAR
jgi:hypothetical protein